MALIHLTGIKTHNLKDISIEIPLGKLVCITGPSGSGKSSLAFDTIYQEGRRRYFSALSLNEQWLPQIKPPNIKSAEGLPPTIGLEQKILHPSQRSTVGTLTGILDFLRILFAELGHVRCPNCGHSSRPLPFHEMVTQILALPQETKIYILSPIKSRDPKAIGYLLTEGFSRFLIDDVLIDLTEEELPSSFKEAKVVIDRLVIRPDIGPRLREAIQLATNLSGGLVHIRLFDGKTYYFTHTWRCPYCNKELVEVRKEFFSFNHPLGSCKDCKGLGEKDGNLCPTCHGKRLRKETELVTLNGIDFGTLGLMRLKELKAYFEGLKFSGVAQRILEGLLSEVKLRLDTLEALELSEVSLFQPITKLSVGELQRLRLAALFVARLSGCLYILDEPGLGLCLREKEKVLFLIRRLINQGNSIIMVEHDPWFIMASDWVIELGPGAGERGGKILFSGSPEGLCQRPDLPTGAYLSGRRHLRRTRKKKIQKISLSLPIREIEIPKATLVCICGPSGSGKSSLLQALEKALIDKGFSVELVKPATGKGQNTIPISYIGAFTPLRELFAGVPEARMRGFKPAHFSFFHKEGRCPNCRGEGIKEIRVPLMPPLRVTCEECNGTGYRRDVLEIRYRGFNIHEVLNLTIDDALQIFSRVAPIREKLKLLSEVGLGYVRLGQHLSTLSGGERQRLRLARSLAKTKKNSFLIINMPTIGLHLVDLEKLLSLFDQLLIKGYTVIVADNHPGIVLLADYLLELDKGKILFSGYLDEWLSKKDGLSDEFESYKSLIDYNF